MKQTEVQGLSIEAANHILDLREASRAADRHSAGELMLSFAFLCGAVALSKEFPSVVFAVPATALFIDSAIRARRADKLDAQYLQARREAMAGKNA